MENEFLNDAEAVIALSELHLAGMTNWKDEENFSLTEKGLDFAWGLWKSTPPKERLALYLLFDLFQETIKQDTAMG